MRRIALALLVAVVIESSLAGSAAASTAAKVSKKDKAILAAGAVRANDVPAGWTSSQPSGSSSSSNILSPPACRSIKAAADAALRAPNAQSPQFHDPTAVTLAADQVFAFKSVKAARSYLAGYTSSDAPSCLQPVYELQSGWPGAEVQGSSAVSSLTNLQGVGDQNVGYEIVVNLTSQGQPLTLYWDLVYLRVGRAIVHFLFNNVGAPLPQSTSIMSPVIARVKRVA